MPTQRYVVHGMTCDHCVRAVSEEVGRLPGVRGVRVDLLTGTVTVDSDPPVDRAAFAAAVGEAGYEVGGSVDGSSP